MNRRGTRPRRNTSTKPRGHEATAGVYQYRERQRAELEDEIATKAQRHGGTKGYPNAICVRRVAVVTGTRAEYGLLRSTMEAIRAKKGLQLQVVTTGTHLLRKFGHTIDDIIADGWPVDARVPMQRGGDSPLDQAEGLARGVAGIARFLGRANTEIVVVLGDRIEAMAGALAGVTTGRMIAHIHGGDVAPGDFDDTLRHAITKLADLHFPATQSAAQRIIGMGESPNRVHVVGAPGLDRLAQLVEEHSRRRPSRKINGSSQVKRSTIGSRNSVVGNWNGHGRRGRALIIQHPCGRSPAHEKRVMKAILGVVREEDLNALCVYPNSDRGHSGIIDAIDVHSCRADPGSFLAVRSMSRDDFLRALIEADMLIGNSSSGIIEAATAGTAVVNIGARQRGREEAGDCIVHCSESQPAIRKAIRSALRKRPILGKKTVYGDGTAGRRIAAILASVSLSKANSR